MILVPLLLATPYAPTLPSEVDVSTTTAAFSIEPSIDASFQGEPTAAAKEHPLAYSYMEGDVIWTDSDDADDKITGLELIGSVAFAKQTFAQVSWSQQSNNADLDRFRIGVGHYIPISPNTDAYGLFSIAHDELSHNDNGFSDTGFATEVGVRSLVTEKFEVSGAIEWVDVHDSDLGLRFGARFFLAKALSLGARAEFIGDDVTFGTGLRLQF